MEHVSVRASVRPPSTIVFHRINDGRTALKSVVSFFNLFLACPKLTNSAFWRHFSFKIVIDFGHVEK